VAEPRKQFLKHRSGAFDEVHTLRWQIADEHDGAPRAKRTCGTAPARLAEPPPE
jgi:hypothetical protein